jgi:hypothetical protein
VLTCGCANAIWCLKELVGPARFERATSCSGGKRSIQLSYGPDLWEENSPAAMLSATGH